MDKTIVILDFDRTINIIHSCGYVAYGDKIRHSSDFILDNIKEGFADFIYQLDGSPYFSYYIASYCDDRFNDTDGLGGRFLIKKYMDTLFGVRQRFFQFNAQNDERPTKDNIIAKMSYDHKMWHLQEILAKESQSTRHPEEQIVPNILLIDDDIANVISFAKKGAQIIDQCSAEHSAEIAQGTCLFMNLRINDSHKIFYQTP